MKRTKLKKKSKQKISTIQVTAITMELPTLIKV